MFSWRHTRAAEIGAAVLIGSVVDGADQKGLIVLQQHLQAAAAEVERARLALGSATITSLVEGWSRG